MTRGGKHWNKISKAWVYFAYLQENKMKWITWRPPQRMSTEVESLKKTNFHTRSKGARKAPPSLKAQVMSYRNSWGPATRWPGLQTAPELWKLRKLLILFIKWRLTNGNYKNLNKLLIFKKVSVFLKWREQHTVTRCDLFQVFETHYPSLLVESKHIRERVNTIHLICLRERPYNFPPKVSKN